MKPTWFPSPPCCPAVGSREGSGDPVVLLHGTGNPAGFFLPLLNELHGVRAIACDRPGVGLSDPIDFPQMSQQKMAEEQAKAKVKVS